MKRTIEIRTKNLKIIATINSDGGLTRGEVDTVRDELADDLMRVAANVRWLGAPLNKVMVK